MRNLIKIVLLVVFIVGCAKDRPVEKLLNPEHEWQSKNALTGSSLNNTPNVWLYKTTVIKTSNNAGFTFTGAEGPTKAGYFKFTKNKLKFYDARDNFKKSFNNLPTLINQWSVDHHDVMLKESGGKVANVEVEDDRKTWDMKNFFTIDFSEADISEAVDFPYSVGIAQTYRCWSKKASHLVDDSLDVQGDYLSFIVAVDYEINALCNGNMLRDLKDDFTYSVQFRYSFKKMDNSSDYKTLSYEGELDPLMKKYGYFKTVRTDFDKKTGKYKNNFLINRWNPNKDHNYYFAKGFPEKLKWIYNDPKKGIFARTNKLFKEAGLKTRFYVRENTWGNDKEKNIGDIRYSFINIVEESSSNAPLGYGPSSANPFTGEIVSANITLWTNSLNYYIKMLKEMEENKRKESGIITGMKTFLGVENLRDLSESSKISKSIKKLHQLVQTKTFASPRRNSYTTSKGANGNKNSSNVSDLDKFLRDLGKEEIADTINIPGESNISNYGHKHDDGICLYSLENAISGITKKISATTNPKQVIDNLLYLTAIHEFGHTLNLRHNFYGSVDSRHFTKSDNGTPGVSSSVMDYLATEDEASIEGGWGQYDKAALLYAYSNGRINETKKEQFLFCTDEHRRLNSMCNAWDKGNTPTQIMLDKIEKYDHMYYLYNFRNGRTFWNTSGYYYSAKATMRNIKSFMSMWIESFNSREVDGLFKTIELNEFNKKEFKAAIDDEMANAMKISIAFYQSIIQLSPMERKFRDSNDNWTGAKESIGTYFDKLFATKYLLGDDYIVNDPSKVRTPLSYLMYLNHPKLKPFIEEVLENTVNSNIDEDNRFNSYAKVLYGYSSVNYINRSDTSLIDKLKIFKFSPSELKEYFDLSPDQSLKVETLSLKVSHHPEFEAFEDIGIVERNGNYFMTSKVSSPYAYKSLLDIKSKLETQGLAVDLYEFYEMYKIYTRLTTGTL